MTVLAGGADESITQPGWLDDGALLFISDQNGFYNLHRFDDQGIRCLLADGADYAQPAWVFGGSEYAAIDDRYLAAIRQTEAGPELVVIDMESGMASPIAGAEDGWCQFGSLAAVGNQLTFIAGFSDRLPAIERFDIASRERKHLVSASEQTSTVRVSEAQALAFPTRDGAVAHGFFYPPWNDHCQPPTNTIPPLLVMSHGGPTAATSAALNPRIQYYTSRGWAVFDVNYRGSSGFGRQYRTALNGRWGELDVWDCEDGVRYLISQGLVDPARIAIRGGSAGGFTTLAALTTTATFRCGASHYGIGDLTALVADTHKFESRYMHTLLADEANLVSRSPINHLDGLSCPVIFFQGGADQVVPENQAQTMVQALQDKGIPVAYLLFPEEGHGFRSAENIIRALESEFAFFSRIFNITPADELPDVEILNMPQGQS
jgi:dipeptidyl aminopeptidase/acylaminoacyl peptidase